MKIEPSASLISAVCVQMIASIQQYNGKPVHIYKYSTHLFNLELRHLTSLTNEPQDIFCILSVLCLHAREVLSRNFVSCTCSLTTFKDTNVSRSARVLKLSLLPQDRKISVSQML